ncbi:hypothetical protein PAMC26577_34560 [Caballeronia sordidicola]|uniref:Uncharacterized protein n=1 Tax=Caballeronia sordidicola TaxID=196367 RepID=A0A242MAF4_CABSO|nr:hypothetical protein PAMC26577_34560 [Caballeronia sordidicola]
MVLVENDLHRWVVFAGVMRRLRKWIHAFYGFADKTALR